MKTTIKLSVSVIILAVLFVSAAYAAPEKFGQPIVIHRTIPMKDILANPKLFKDQQVVIEGTIDQECPSGCWFYVKDTASKASIYVNLEKASLAIPQRKGKKILVEGIVKMKGPAPMIEGRSVEIR